MLLNENTFDVLSTNPLWTYDENNDPKLIKNVYDTIEVIRVYVGARSNDTYFDIPIEDPITCVPYFGTFFFKTQNECARYANLIDDIDGKQTVLENAFELTRRNKCILSFKLDKNKRVEDGIYIIPRFEEELRCGRIDSNDSCYVAEDFELKKFMLATSDVDYYLRQYLQRVDIENRYPISEFRVIFEIYTEGNKVYINHYNIPLTTTFNSVSVMMFSRILNYPICANIGQGSGISKLLKAGGSIAYDLQGRQNIYDKMKKNDERRERNRETRKKIVDLCLDFAWKNKGAIMSKVGGKLSSLFKK